MLKYRQNVLEMCKKAGYNTYYLKKNNIISQSAIQDLRKGNKIVGIHTISAICDLLQCQPGDLIYWEKDSKNSEKSE